MAENVPENTPSGSSPTSTRTLLLEGLALTLLLISFVRRVISVLRVRKGYEPDRSHYLPPNVKIGGEIGPVVHRGDCAYVTVTPRTLLKIGATMVGHISYQYTLSNESSPQTVDVAESFLFEGGQDDQIKQYTILTDSAWQTLAVKVYSHVSAGADPHDDIFTGLFSLQ